MSRGVTLATSLKSDAIEMMQPVERPRINFSTSKNCIYDSDGGTFIHVPPFGYAPEQNILFF